MNESSFKLKHLQIDLFGSSVELLAADGTEYFFYLEENNSFKTCYLKTKKSRKKLWSNPEILKDFVDREAKFKFSDSNEFGFCLN